MLVGRYRKGGAAKINLTGSAGGKKQAFTFHSTFAETSNGETNGFVARLWATRRIGDIIDDLDLHGRNQELVDELVALSQKHGILTPYTSFLADENVSLSSRKDNAAFAARSAAEQLSVVGGSAGFMQREEKAKFQNATNAPAAPGAQSQTLRQVGRKAFFKKGRLWQDSTVTAEQAKTAIHVVQFSPRYFDLAASHGGIMARYLAFKEPVLVNLGAQTYQIDSEPAR